MPRGLRLLVNGRYVYFDPARIVSAGYAPVLLILGHWTQVQDYLNGLPKMVRYRDGTEAFSFETIYISDNATFGEAEFMCRHAQSSRCVVAVGAASNNIRAQRMVQQYAQETIRV